MNPFAEVEVVGRRRKGKQQLRIDEARKYEAAARELADRGDVGAIERWSRSIWARELLRS